MWPSSSFRLNFRVKSGILPSVKAKRPFQIPKIIVSAVFSVLALIAVFVSRTAFALDFPFADVPDSDPIHDDLQKLYDRGVVDLPADGKFHPDALMNRDEFTSIAIGVGCKKCLTPTAEDILKYRTAPFIDFDPKSPYFYCVSYAKEQ